MLGKIRDKKKKKKISFHFAVILYVDLKKIHFLLFYVTSQKLMIGKEIKRM